MDIRTRYDDFQQAVETVVDMKLAHVHTALPCVIVSVDANKQTAVIQPTVKARIRKADGTQTWVQLPQIVDAPLHFPTGGGVTMTFPVKPGDEALAVFSSRSKQTWQQQGGVQQPVDLRMHDLSHAFVMVGFKSQPNALANVSTDSTQIRSNDGQQVIDLNPSSGLTFQSGGVKLAITSAGVEGSGGYLKWNGKTIDDTHVHTGVTPGPAETGTPA